MTIWIPAVDDNMSPLEGSPIGFGLLFTYTTPIPVGWTNENNSVGDWVNQTLVVYLLTEDGENILDETRDLILVEEGNVGIFSNESNPNGSWIEEGIPVTTWN